MTCGAWLPIPSGSSGTTGWEQFYHTTMVKIPLVKNVRGKGRKGVLRASTETDPWVTWSFVPLSSSSQEGEMRCFSFLIRIISIVPSLTCKGLTEMPKNPLARMRKRGKKKTWRPVGKQEARGDINSSRETSDGHTVAPKSWLSGHRRPPGLWPWHGAGGGESSA